MKQSTFYYLLRRGVIGGGGITPLVRNFKQRVESDGGIVEKLSCVQQAISTLPGGPSFGVFTFGLFSERVTTDGGTTEAQICTEDSLNYLNSNYTI